MALQPATNRQVPDHGILDHYNKQTYLGNKYSYFLSETAVGTAESPFIYLSNPSVTATGFPSGYSALFVDLRRVSGVTAAALTTIRVYLNPTVSVAGTVQTPTNLRPASPNTSIAVVQSLPTTSSNGTLIEVLPIGSNATNSSDLLIVLDPGQSLLVTIQSTASSSVSAQVAWYEL